MKYQYLFPIIPALRGILARPNETRPRFAFTRDGVVGQEGNMLFLVTPNGKTKYITENNSRLPIEGTRYPEQWLMWHIINFVKANPNRLAFLLLFLVVLAVGNMVALYLPANSNPFGEELLWGYTTFSKAMFFVVYGVVAIACAALLAGALTGSMWRVGREWAAEPKADETLLIEAGNPLAPDYLIDSSSPDETAKQFFDRVAECRRANGEHCFVIAVPFGEDKFIICHPAPADKETAEEVAGVRAAYVHGTTRADGETWEEYKHFLSRVRQPLKDYCFEQREKTPGIGALSALSAQMKGAVVALFILCFVVPGMAQSKTQRLYNYLGTRAETIVPHDDTQVEFAFEGATLTRVGDGRSNLVTLLKKPRVFTDDDNAGVLRKVKINGEVLPPIKGSEKPVAKTNYIVGEGSAVPVDGDSEQKSLWSSLPDSAQAVEDVYRWKGEAKKAHRKFMFVTFYYWDYFSWWMHQNAFPFLTLALLLFGIPAVASSSEFMVNTFGNSVVGNSFRILHKGSAFMMCLTLIVFAVVVGLDVVIAAITAGWHWAALIALSYIVSRLAGWLIGKIVPNAKIVGNHPSDSFFDHNRKRIG